uniref:ATP synthase subunit a n=1 Tax=Diptera sp. 53 LC-2017 TaxID=2030330 RepID=A0A2D1CQ00_9DIPT|nr:ATP synthase F0 subunit 6 [Diptera sp. 53 LC-2017]
MMTNLFSMFDPSTNLFYFNLSLNWLSMIILMMIMPMKFWLMNNNISMIFKKFIITLNKEMKMIINKKKNLNFNLILISLMFIIMVNNFMGLFPYIFTCTSHMNINLSMALPIWLSMMLYLMMNKLNNMFIHLVPQNTPNLLIPFMVMIESISLIIRPITLTIRLTANMIAGHLLLTLMSSLSKNLSKIFISLLIVFQTILMSLEMAVSIIQAYVFTILITLYLSEI